MTPIEPVVEAAVARLSLGMREAFEERAGIMQFEAGKPREVAEPLALLDVLRMHPLALTGAVCMSGLAPGGPLYVLALDDRAARASLSLLGAQRGAPADLSIALASLGGAACLTPLNPVKKARKSAYLK